MGGSEGSESRGKGGVKQEMRHRGFFFFFNSHGRIKALFVKLLCVKNYLLHTALIIIQVPKLIKKH